MPPKPLPKQQPNLGERLVIRDPTPDGRFNWSYRSLTKAQIALIGSSDVRLIELHIKNFRVSELQAALANFPNYFPPSTLQTKITTPIGANGVGIFLVVDLDESFSGATHHALDFIKTVGITSSSDGTTIIGAPGTAPLSVSRNSGPEDMRRVIFQGLTVQYNPSKVDGAQVSDFWEEIGTLRDLSWNQEEMARWVVFKWAVKRKRARDAKRASDFTKRLWGSIGVFVLLLAWLFWRYGLGMFGYEQGTRTV